MSAANCACPRWVGRGDAHIGQSPDPRCARSSRPPSPLCKLGLPRKRFSHPAPQREQPLEPGFVVLPKRADRHAAHEAHRRGRRDRRRFPARTPRAAKRLRPRRPRPAVAPAARVPAAPGIAQSRALGRRRQHDVEGDLEMRVEEELARIPRSPRRRDRRADRSRRARAAQRFAPVQTRVRAWRRRARFLLAK